MSYILNICVLLLEIFLKQITYFLRFSICNSLFILSFPIFFISLNTNCAYQNHRQHYMLQCKTQDNLVQALTNLVSTVKMVVIVQERTS